MTFLIPSPTGVTRGSMDTRVKHEPNRLTNVSEYKHLKNNKSKLNITKTQKKNWRRNRYPQPSIRERNNIIILELLLISLTHITITSIQINNPIRTTTVIISIITGRTE